MSIVNKLGKVYGGNWMVTETERFTEEDAKCYSGAEVVPCDYGMSICLTMIDGSHKQYVQLSRDSQLKVGDKPNLTDLQVLTLQRDGECCIRIEEAK
jgi:hypothetical protein